MPQTFDEVIADIFTIKNDTIPSTAWPKLTCGVANEVTVQDSSLKLGDQREIFFQNAGQLRAVADLRFLTGSPAATEKLRILANGNVGIGTANPQGKLDVSGNIVLNGNPKTQLSTIGEVTFLKGDVVVAKGRYVELDMSQNGSGILDIGSNPNDNAVFLFGFSADRTRSASAMWFAGKDGGKLPLIQMSANTTYIDSNVGIGTSTPTCKLDVKATDRIKLGLEGNGGGQLILANNSGDNKVYVEAFNAAGNGSAAELLLTGANADPVPIITLVANSTFITGNLTVQRAAFKPGGGSWGSTSDLRLKKKIEPLTGALEKLLQLRGVCFEWTEPEKMGNQRGLQRGLIAQEVESVFPEWISADTDGYKLLTIMGFEALMIEALRELKSEVESLKAQLVESAGKRPSRSQRDNR
jgi:hypothetical protein